MAAGVVMTEIAPSDGRTDWQPTGQAAPADDAIETLTVTRESLRRQLAAERQRADAELVRADAAELRADRAEVSCRRAEAAACEERCRADIAEWHCGRERAQARSAEAARLEACARAEDLRLMLQAMVDVLIARAEELSLLDRQLRRANERAADLQEELGVARDDLTLAQGAIDRARAATQAARPEAERLQRRLRFAWRGR
jgi:hypothetical protein